MADVKDRFTRAVSNNDLGTIQSLLNDEDAYLIVQQEIKNKTKPLHLAIQNKNLSMVTLFLQNGANISWKNNNSDSCLHTAVKTGAIELVHLFLDANVKVDAQDYKGNTALHLAVKIGRMSIVKLLLSKGANPNEQNFNRDSPFHLGFYYKLIRDGASLNLFLSYGADISHRNQHGRAVHLAARYGTRELLQKLIALEWSSKKLFGQNLDEEFLLHSAAQGNTLSDERMMDKLDYLLDYRADVNKVNEHEKTALYYVASNPKKVRVVEYLITRGANVNVALCAAVKYNSYNVLKVLSNYGIELGSYVIFEALMEARNALKSIDSLLRVSNGSTDPNSELGRRIFANAIKSAKVDMVKHLLDGGIDVNVECDGLLPLAMAYDSFKADSLHSLESIHILLGHMALLLDQHLYVDRNNVALVDAIVGNVDPASIYRQYVEKLAKLKKQRVCNGTSVTCYKILTMESKQQEQLVTLLSYKQIDAVLRDPKKFDEKFSYYCHRIRRNLGKLRTQLMMMRFERILHDMLGAFLPREVICHISKYYNEHDFAACLR